MESAEGVPEFQCAIKRETQAPKDEDKANSTTRDNGSDKDEKPIGSPQVVPPHKTQEELISKLVLLQEEYESQSEEDFTQMYISLDESQDTIKMFDQINKVMHWSLQLIVEFSKRVPGVDTLPQKDQIKLLEASSSKVMMLRTARNYDIKTDSIVFANNQPYMRENHDSVCEGESADSIFNFCKNMCLLKMDNAEYALLTAIVIFSEQPCLLESKKVEQIKDFYIDALMAYIDTNRPPGENYFARLLSTFEELRTLCKDPKMCFSLKCLNLKVPLLLQKMLKLLE